MKGAPCPANSTRQTDGTCKCDAGLSSYNGVCSKCPVGALWSSSVNKCIFVCGQNAAFNTASNACACLPTFGMIQGICQQCPSNYYVANGYCVTCPVSSTYNPKSTQCECNSGFQTSPSGICQKKCNTNEVFNQAACQCVTGLGRINGTCQICPSGSSLSADGTCNTCGANQVLVNGKCSCAQGFALNSGQVCTACASIPGAFLLNGICSTCPGNLIYDGSSSCICPVGQTAIGVTCVSACQADELVDNNGACYKCPINQVISNGVCVCVTGFVRSLCGACQLSCTASQFIYGGKCASCPLSTIYNSAINGCSCPTGFYLSNYGTCEKLVLAPIACSDGQYFDQTNGCIACPSTCKTCKSATQCLTCSANGFSANTQGQCAPLCGDGIIVGN